MSEMGSQILNILCKGSGQGNSNTDKLAKELIKLSPDLDYTQMKIQVVEELKELTDMGELQIMTINWELGEEFLYVCTNIIE